MGSYSDAIAQIAIEDWKIERAVTLYNEGYPLNQIAEFLEYSVTEVLEILREEWGWSGS